MQGMRERKECEKFKYYLDVYLQRKSFSQEEKPNSEKPAESKPEEIKPQNSKPEVTTSDQNAEASEKPRGNDEGSGNQEEKKKEERLQLTVEKVGNFT